jgi:hypothetical protein
MAVDEQLPTREELERFFPVDRDPKVIPRAMDELDTPDGTIRIVGTLGRAKNGYPMLVVFDRGGARYGVTSFAWKREMKRATVKVRAEDTIPASWKAILGR